MGRLWYPVKKTRIMDMGILNLGRNGGVKNWRGIRNARGIEHVLFDLFGRWNWIILLSVYVSLCLACSLCEVFISDGLLLVCAGGSLSLGSLV
jgi:hypothetical protein